MHVRGTLDKLVELVEALPDGELISAKKLARDLGVESGQARNLLLNKLEPKGLSVIVRIDGHYVRCAGNRRTVRNAKRRAM